MSTPVRKRGSAPFNTSVTIKIRAVIGALIAALMALVMAVGGMVQPANAAGTHKYLTIDKTVDQADSEDLAAGQSFTYNIALNCAEENCVNATMTDLLPADLQGFTVTGVEITPASVGGVASWTEAGAPVGQPATVGAATGLTVALHEPFSGGSGLVVGTTAHVNVTLQVPNDFSPNDPRNDKPIENTATSTADNSADDSSSATVTVKVAQTIAADIAKTWSPDHDGFDEGAASAIALTSTNTSNVDVDTLTVQDPQESAAPDSAAALAAGNPFRYVDFTGFGTPTTMPPGAETVQVDAYVLRSGVWTWVSGTPGTDFSLPSGVAVGDVAGLRFTYTGTLAPGAADSVVLNLAQRSTDRQGGAAIPTTQTLTITNLAQAQTSKNGVTSTVATDDATYTVSPAAVGTTVDKSFTPNRVPAGNSSIGTITATNTQSSVKTLVISDKDFFTDELTFGGFTQPISWPSGAASGKITYHMLDGSADQSVDIDNGLTTPTAPTGKISGFEIVFDSTSNTIVTGAQSTATFQVKTSSAVDFGDKTELTSTNTATSTVTAVNEQTETDQDTADLTRVKPGINVDLEKSIKPSGAVEPGHDVIVDLTATTNASSDYVKPTTIVVEDSWGEGKPVDGFWNAFDLTAIQPTQVPADTKLTVEVQKSDGEWKVIDTQAAQEAASLYQLSASDLTSKLDAAGAGAADTLTGIRFTFESTSRFPSNTTVHPYVDFTARATTRADDSVKTDTLDPDTNTDADQRQTAYKNAATTTGTGKTDDGKDLTGTDDDTATTGVIVYPGGGTGPGVHISKDWDKASVPSQSGATATTALNWRVDSGLTQVTITDPATGENKPASTVFDAFNLTTISAIAASSTPYSNGWYLKYDTISQIELYNGSTWQPVTAPEGGWQDANGGFKGYTLTEAEQASTTAVRLTVVPNDPARTAALTGGTDPYAPPAGSGVAASSGDRTFPLTWQLRNVKRSAPSVWVTGGADYNTVDKGTVENTVLISGTTADNQTTTDTAEDTIKVADQDPLVTVSKSVATGAIQVPAPGTVDASAYPTDSYTLTARNGSTTGASYVRVTDPAACTDSALGQCQTTGDAAGALADPFKDNADVKAGVLDTAATPNPFNRQDITKVTIGASIPAQVDLGQSTVWLLHFTPGAEGSTTGTYTTTSTTAAAVNAMTAAELADVVGISVTFQGADPATNGGSITQGNALTVKIDTQVRATLRTTGADFIPNTDDLRVSNNRVFAQSYDPVTSPTIKTGDVDDASVEFSSGTIDVNPGKTITPGTIAAPNPKAPQTVTLKADQGTSSTVAPKQVVITDLPDGTDGSSEFWANFDFTGLTGITFPANADQVQIDAYANGTWTTGTAQPKSAGTFTLPSGVQNQDVAGLRFTFSRSDGKLFSSTTWSAKAIFTAVLRDTQRGSTDSVVFPSSATDKMTAQSIGALAQTDEKPATAGVQWNDGDLILAINKLANNGTRSAQVGQMIPWDITVKNAGTGYLDLTQVVDNLPAALKYTGVGSPADPSHPVQFTAGKLADDTPGTLSAAPTVDSSDPTKLVFTWPAGQSRLQPTETAVIRVWLELQPGPVAGEQVTNHVSVFTQQDLKGVSKVNPGDGAGAVSAAGDTGATTFDSVTPTVGENLFVVKGVKGSLAGAVNTNDPSQTCTPTLSGLNGENYYRTPCAANSTVNGTDDWVLHMVNAGTTNVTRAQFFDQLPVQDDKYLVASENGRGTQYRPQLLDDLGNIAVVGAPTGTTTTVEVTTDANACVNTWNTDLTAMAAGANACTANTWAVAGSGTEWSKVTAIRVTLDFTTSEDTALRPGKGVDVTFSTVNVPQTSADASGASTDVPATDQFAWNQFGLIYQGLRTAKIAPSLVGVHLRTGSIEVTKDVIGAAAAYAPDAFTASVACTIPGPDDQAVPLTFDGAATKQVTLTKGEDGAYAPATVSGIPVGATCTVSEDGAQGSFGETTRSIDKAQIQVTTPDATDGVASDPIASSQIATITNDYQMGGLSVTKQVETEADKGTFGPFDFTATCTAIGGAPVDFGDGQTTQSFTLKDGETWTAPENTIPIGSSCTITETDNGSADSTVFTGDNITATDGTSVTVRITGGDTAVTNSLVTNHFDAGTFTVAKTVDGAGAQTYGNGDFGFHSACDYQGQTLLDEDYTLVAGATRTFGVFPTGTVCTTTETANGGATAQALDPADGAVTISAATDEVPSVTVTATNTFDTTSLSIVKKVTGAAAESRGAGPFTAQATCTYQKDGQTTPVPLSNDGTVVLDAANGYKATIGNIIVGAECAVVETDKGGADATTMDPADGKVTLADQTGATVTITNVFNEKGKLSKTGANVITAVLAGLLLLGGGGALTLTQRRRRQRGTHLAE